MDKVYSKSPDVVFRKIADECILVPIRNNVGDMESIYTLNESASRIWELMDGKRTTGQIAAVIAEEFEAAPKQAEEDLQEILDQLEKIEAITTK